MAIEIIMYLIGLFIEVREYHEKPNQEKNKQCANDRHSSYEDLQDLLLPLFFLLPHLLLHLHLLLVWVVVRA